MNKTTPGLLDLEKKIKKNIVEYCNIVIPFLEKQKQTGTMVKRAGSD